MKQLYLPSKHYFYLACFRIYLALHILQKIFFYMGNTDTLFGNNSFVDRNNDPFFAMMGLGTDFFSTHYLWFLIVFAMAALAVLFGIGRNVSILVLYLLLEIFQRLNHFILNGGDNLLKFLLLYMVFADSFRHLTLFKGTKAPSTINSTGHLLTNLAVVSIKVHLCLVYFISGIFKANTKLWFSGLATYYTFLNERFQGTTWNRYLVQSGFFVTFSTYFVMLWELFFPFLVSVKKLRMFTLISGVLIHIGIFVFMMIYDFEILFVACYGFFYTDEELKTGFERTQKKLQNIRALPLWNVSVLFKKGTGNKEQL